MIRVSRGLIRYVRSSGGCFDDYRYYVIARHHYALRSGIFSLDEFCDLLHAEYGYSSLHRRPGNDRKRFKERLWAELSSSTLFSMLSDNRLKANSERGLLSRYNKGNNKTGWFEIPDMAILRSKKQFFDFCVGVLLSGNKFRANKNIAGFCGVTVRRIRQATARNHKQDHFHKQFNFIEDFSGSYEEVERFRAILYNVHGISSPLPYKRKGEWVLRLNAPNSYHSNVLSGFKGDRAQPTVVTGKKERCWFMPAREKDKQLKLFKDYNKRWFFNSSIYSTDHYIQDHSRMLT